jgi:hypothetical protein
MGESVPYPNFSFVAECKGDDGYPGRSVLELVIVAKAASTTFLLRTLRLHRKMRIMRIETTATPPTVPPAMAATFVFEEDVAVLFAHPMELGTPDPGSPIT